MLKVEGIYKKYGKKQVLKNLSFVVPEGSIYTLVGAFGEGKTTLLNIIAGYDKADRGNVYIKDVECQTKPTKAKELFGFVPDNFPMYEELSGKEYLEFFGTIMSQKDEDQIKHLAVNLLGFVGLQDFIDVRIKKYDYHMRQKLSIARALLHNPKFIILDEPFYGLDVKHVKEIIEIIEFLHKQGRTIFMTSDNLKLSASVSTAVGIMEDGTMLYGEKIRGAYESLASMTRIKDITLRNDMIKERTINMSAKEDVEEFDYEHEVTEYAINHEITKSPNDDLEDINHTMRRMPDVSQTMHKMPDISQTMHRMPDIDQTMYRMPDIDQTMHRIPPVEEPIKMPYGELEKIHNSRTGEDLSKRIVTSAIYENYEGHSRGHFGEYDNYSLSNTQQPTYNNLKNKNRLNVEKRGAGGSRVVTNKNNIRKK